MLISILKDEPRNKYARKNLESHTCLYTFRVACDIYGVSKEVFSIRCDYVTLGFITRNVIYVHTLLNITSNNLTNEDTETFAEDTSVEV